MQANLRRDQRRLAREAKKDRDAEEVNKPRNKIEKKSRRAGRQPALDRATAKHHQRSKAEQKKSSTKLPPAPRNVTAGAASSFTLANPTTPPKLDKKQKRAEPSSLDIEVDEAEARPAKRQESLAQRNEPTVKTSALLTTAPLTSAPAPPSPGQKRKREESSLEEEGEEARPTKRQEHYPANIDPSLWSLGGPKRTSTPTVLDPAPPTLDSAPHGMRELGSESLERQEDHREDSDLTVAEHPDSGTGVQGLECGYDEWLFWGNGRKNHHSQDRELAAVRGPDPGSGPEAQEFGFYGQQEAWQDFEFGTFFEYPEPPGSNIEYFRIQNSFAVHNSLFYEPYTPPISR